MRRLSVVIIGPDAPRRQQLAAAVAGQQPEVVRELDPFPSLNGQNGQFELGEFDVILIDLDPDQDTALDLVSRISTENNAATVMAYSTSRDPELVVRCMRAGAREFLSLPLLSAQLGEALERAATRLPLGAATNVARKFFLFWGAKGGVGATTLATNFAIALRAESGQHVALVDLNLQLGDVAMALGVEPQFSVLDALESAHRLDQEFLSALMIEHPSGISVLAGPDQFIRNPAIENGNLSLLLQVLRDKFPYVVMDAGSGMGAEYAALFRNADRVYLITEADVPTLRNTQRLVAHLRLRNGAGPNVELVLNRFRARGEISEKRITEALGVPVNWRVPNDYIRVQEALNRGVPLAETRSPVTGVLRQMARLACGKPSPPQRPGWKIRLRKHGSRPWIVSRSD
jgi:pilus assembly protein CpaE